MPAYIIYNQLISTIIMVIQDVPNLPLMILIIKPDTSMMIHIYNNLLDPFPIVHLSRPLSFHLNIIAVLVTIVTHRVVISSLQLTINLVIHQSIIHHLLLRSIIHVPNIRHLLLW